MGEISTAPSGPTTAPSGPTTAPTEDEMWATMMDSAAASINAEKAANPDGTEMMAEEMDPVGSALAGAAKAFFEAKDTIFGEPNYEDKSTPRQFIETLTARREQQKTAAGLVNGFARNIGQFTTGMLGMGKATWFLKGGKTATTLYNAGRAAATGAVAFDPYEARLSNLIEQYPALSNPVTRYLKADLGDTKAEGRLKATLESLGLDAVLAGAFAGAAKVAKLSKAGMHGEATQAEAVAMEQLSRAMSRMYFPTEDLSKVATPSGQGGRFIEAERRAATPTRGQGGDQTLYATPQGDVSPDLEGLADARRQYQAAEDLAREQATPPSRAANKYFLDYDQKIAFDERVARLEIDEGLTRAAAERQAMEELGGWPGGAPSRQRREGATNNAQTELPLAAQPAEPPANAGVGPSAPPGGGPDMGGSGAPAQRTGDDVLQGPREGTEQVPPGSPRPRAEPPADVTLPEIVVPGPDDLERMRKDNAAIERAGSMKEAIDGGYSFGGRYSFPWQLFNGPDEAAAWFGRVLDNNAVTIERARGGRMGADGRAVMSDAQVDNLVDQYINILGEDPGLVTGVLRATGEQVRDLAAKMETAVTIANRAIMDNYQLARQIEVGNYGAHGTREAALGALKAQQQIAVEFTAQARAMLAAAGRTVRRARGEFRARADALQRAAIDAADGEQLLRGILMTDGSPAAMNKLMKPSLAGLLFDHLGTLQAANLLWGWSTHAVNFAMNMGMLAWRPLETGLGATALGVAGRAARNEGLSAAARNLRAQARKEVMALGSVLTDGIQAAKEAFINGDSRLSPHAIEALHDAGTQSGRVGTGAISRDMWRPINGIDDLAYNALVAFNLGSTTPLRLLGAADEMVRTMRYRAVVMGRAGVEADAMGLKAGSKQYAEFVKARVQSSFDDAGRATDADALAEAKATVFGQDLLTGEQPDLWFRTSLGALMQQGTANFAPLRAIVPFVRTPTNLFRYGVKLTPGLNLLQREYLNAFRGAKGTAEQARAVGQMMLGTMLASAAVPLALNGTITGSGPIGAQKQRAWKAEGNMPYAFNWTGGDGKRHSVQLNRLDPVQFPFMLIADAVSMLQMGALTQDEEQSVASSIILALSHQLSDKTYLKNLSDMLEFMGDPINRAKNPQQVLQSYIPFYTLLKNATGEDYLKEAHSALDTLKSGLPGFSDDVPDRYDFSGERVKVPGRFVNTRTIDGPLADALDEAYAEVGYVPMPMAPTDSASNVDYRDLRLENGKTAYERLQELSARPLKGMRTMRDALASIVETSAYKVAPHGRPDAKGTKEYMLTAVVSKYRQAAKAKLQGESKMFRDALHAEARRNWEAIVSRRKDARLEGAKETIKSVAPVLNTYGLGGILPQVPEQ